MLDLGILQEPIHWDTTSRDGEDFGPDWKDYRVEFTKVIVEKSAPDCKAHSEWFEVLPDDPNKMSCLICIRIFYKFSYAFTEVLSAGNISPRFVLGGCIQNAGSIRSVHELEAVWRGLKLASRPQKKRPGPKSRWDKDTFERTFIDEYVEICEKKGLDKTSIEKVSQAMNISRDYLYELCGKFDLKPNEMKAEASLRLIVLRR